MFATLPAATASGIDFTSGNDTFTDTLAELDCYLPDKEDPVKLGQYLRTPANYLTSVPAPPPPKAPKAPVAAREAPAAATMEQAAKGGASRDTGLIVGVAVAAVAVVLGSAGLAAFIVKRKQRGSGPLAYQKDGLPSDANIEVVRTQPMAFN
jgi:hypothetical protein